MNAPSSELAVLFADVSGSTRLYETLGDERALEAVAHCLEVAKSACADYGGQVIKTIGDEVMVAFAGADAAAQAAANLQARMSAEPAWESQRLMMRIGFHFGPALASGGDVYGDSVNVAARLQDLAKDLRCEVVISADVCQRAGLAAPEESFQQVRIRGRDDPLAVYAAQRARQLGTR